VDELVEVLLLEDDVALDVEELEEVGTETVEEGLPDAE
jgi:hypothetical protein